MGTAEIEYWSVVHQPIVDDMEGEDGEFPQISLRNTLAELIKDRVMKGEDVVCLCGTESDCTTLKDLVLTKFVTMETETVIRIGSSWIQCDQAKASFYAGSGQLRGINVARSKLIVGHLIYIEELLMGVLLPMMQVRGPQKLLLTDTSRNMSPLHNIVMQWPGIYHRKFSHL